MRAPSATCDCAPTSPPPASRASARSTCSPSRLTATPTRSDPANEPARQANPDLDYLIAEITVDAHDEDEQLTSFENAFNEDASFPCPGTVIGEQVEVLHVSRANNRRELIATCQRDRRRYELALLDIDLNADQATTRLLAAYQRWMRD